MSRNRRVIVVIAGGKSSRMKKDKALLPFGQFATLAQYQVERLSEYFDEIYLSAKSDKFNFDIKIIEDRYEASSPLVAIVSIFETVEYDEIFIMSVDTPFVSLQTIERLYQEAEKSPKSDAVVAHSVKGIEPLCAVYKRSSVVVGQALLAENRHRLQSFLEQLNISIVRVEEEREFINLNYPQEYNKARLNDCL